LFYSTLRYFYLGTPGSRSSHQGIQDTLPLVKVITGYETHDPCFQIKSWQDMRLITPGSRSSHDRIWDS
jgi:hypothetical protein